MVYNFLGINQKAYRNLLTFDQNIRTVYLNICGVYPIKNHVTTHTRVCPSWWVLLCSQNTCLDSWIRLWSNFTLKLIACLYLLVKFNQNQAWYWFLIFFFIMDLEFRPFSWREIPYVIAKLLQCSPLIKLCLGSIDMEHPISDPCYSRTTML